MGLVELHYPHTWENIEVDSNRTIRIWIPGEQGLLPLTSSFQLPPANYDTESGLVEAINKAVYDEVFSFQGDEELVESSKKYWLKQRDDLGLVLLLRYSKKNNRIKIKTPYPTCSISFPPLLQYILGFGSEQWVSINRSILAKYPPDLTAGFNSIYVYCDLVEPQVIGNTLAPILRIASIEGKNGDFINKIFLTPHYCRLRTRTFDSVEISLKTDTNDLIKFNFGKVIAKVHLRKI